MASLYVRLMEHRLLWARQLYQFSQTKFVSIVTAPVFAVARVVDKAHTEEDYRS